MRTAFTAKEVATLEKRIKKNPDDVEALVELGAARFEPGRDPEGAEELIRRALHADPTNTDALFWLAKIRFHDHIDAAEAKSLLESALTIQPKRADCLGLLASVLDELDTPAERVVEYLVRAVTAEPEWPALRHHYGLLLVHLGRLDEAEEQAHRGLEALRKINEQIPICYYEESVTGRRWPHMRTDLEKLLMEIARRRGRSTHEKASSE